MDVKKPVAVKITVILFGLLAFLSWVALGRSEPGTSNTLAAVLRAFPATLAFIGVLSNTKLGRQVAVAVLFLLCLGGVFGLLAAIKSFASSPVLAIVGVAMVIGIFLRAGFYVFGASTRAYYSAVFALKHAGEKAA
ncbi:hypothetical protein [Thiobacillus sp.]|uniref:hypothetical protein n=1 Tax=Thiobacillus sp. TaxID=924 RepID=UPI00286E77EF|nr:hypothetical protein [Thiobacillus sp.]